MKIIRPKEIKSVVGFTSHYCHRLAAQGKFPRAVRLGPQAVGWIEEEVQDWMRNLPRKGDAADADEAGQ